MFLKRSSQFLTSVGLVTSLLTARSLPGIEQKIIASVNADGKASEELLEQMVNINSGTLNPAGVRKMADFLKPKFESLGFTCRFIPQEEVHRGGHMSCERKGTSGKRVLLIGHMDTVFEADSPFQKFTREGDKTSGPGAADMKGGLAIMLSALKALNENHAIDNTTITVFLTGDEERALWSFGRAALALVVVFRSTRIANSASVVRDRVSV